jgi:predicted DNA-binding antitoxin AbrB/MazE fold protein
VDNLRVEAVYEHGTLKLAHELPLPEGQKVLVTVHTPGGAVERLYGMSPWKGDLDEFDRWLNDPDEGQWGSRDV